MEFIFYPFVHYSIYKYLYLTRYCNLKKQLLMSLFVSLTLDMDDETLFAKVERGDVEAFTVVYNKYHKLLYVLAYRYLMDKAMAEDAVQHVFYAFLGVPFGTSRRHQPEELPRDDDEESYSERNS